MDDLNLAREMSIEVVYVDEHLIELAATIGAGHWCGRATAYTVPAEVTRFADALLRFVVGGPPAAFEAGAETGIGLIGLRFYRSDRAGHIACHARLALGGVPTEHRPEQVSRLAVEFGAEAWAVEQFAQQLAEIARTQAGRADLAIKP
ncbi:MAG: hypothetical protein K1X57_19860 [Gemmataceae bacterium]|nr:hypothetical protein [Gemmataceae bacterium]